MFSEKYIESPCTNLCLLDSHTRICLGCFRTIEEIISWVDFSDEHKKQVLQKVEERKKSKSDRTA
jgi:uncharacterized protein